MRFLIGLTIGLLASYGIIYALKLRSRDRVSEELGNCQRDLKSAEQELAELESAPQTDETGTQGTLGSEAASTDADAAESEPELPATSAPQPTPATRPTEISSSTGHKRSDDLKRIEGIGPKIADLLGAAGIDSFQALANSDPATLSQILEQGGRRFGLARPDSWPEQAQLAANGDWEALKTLQGELKGGQRS